MKCLLLSLALAFASFFFADIGWGMTHQEYLDYGEKVQIAKTDDPVLFLDSSKKALLTKFSAFDANVMRQASGLFDMSADYNALLLICAMGVDKGFPILDEHIEGVKKWSSQLEGRTQNAPELALLISMRKSILDNDRKLKGRIGLPTDLDENLRLIEFPTDTEILAKYPELDPLEILVGKWPGVRTGPILLEDWVKAEKDPKTEIAATKILLLEILHDKDDEITRAIFSDLYFNKITLRMLSLVGNRFSATQSEMEEFRQHTRLAAARTTTDEQLEYLKVLYCVVVRGSEIMVKAGK